MINTQTTKSQKILIVTTSADKLGPANHETGLWLEELTAPYYAFVDAGHEVTIASIAGGRIPLDPTSLTDEAESNIRYFKDKSLQQQLTYTRSVDELSADDYDGIFLPGGHGTMVDFAVSKKLGELVSKFAAQDKIVGAVCHGPVGLVNAVSADGSPLVKGRMVAGFSDSEENATGLKDVVPYLLEARLRELGGNYEGGPDFKPFAVRDGYLVTGQNPQSSSDTANLFLEAIQARTLTPA